MSIATHNLKKQGHQPLTILVSRKVSLTPSLPKANLTKGRKLPTYIYWTKPKGVVTTKMKVLDKNIIVLFVLYQMKVYFLAEKHGALKGFKKMQSLK